ncbi:hypothetical protein GCM10027346_06770 [Hymenobacter seoulensis]
MQPDLHSPVQSLLNEYGESHQNPTNKLVHWVCVPLIMFSILGLLWSIPVPQSLQHISPWLNWATLIMVLAVGYYLRLSGRLAVGMVLVWALMAGLLHVVDAAAVLPLWGGLPDRVCAGLDWAVLGP